MPAVLSDAALTALANRFVRASLDAPKEFERAKASIVRAAGTEGRRQISAVYSLTQARIGQDLRATATPAGALVVGQRKPITFTSYGFRQTRKGLRGKILRAGEVQTFEGGFIATGLGGGQIAFYRSGTPRKMTKGRYIGRTRQPIKALHGPSIADALRDTRVSEPLKERIYGRAARELRQRLARLGGRR